MPTEPLSIGLADAATVVAGFVAYALFAAWAAARRLGQGKTPLVPFNRAHLRMSLLYAVLALSALLLTGRSLSPMWLLDLAVGAFFYFGLHYAIFLHFFGMAQASVSTSIISIAYRNGGRATREEIVVGYAGGDGFEYIKRSRLSRLETFLKWIERSGNDDRYRVTPAGAKAIKTTRFFLRTWSLTQLESKP